MVQSQFSLSWDSYKSNICNGFSSLQQNGEFVDMTLAADGHFVKVHQVLMALVSPYLKELINSAPCQHPVIFLNNVSSKTLSCLLEYIYTGEVLIPSEHLTSFVEVAKNLHIKGLENFKGTGTEPEYRVVDNLSQVEDNLQCHMTGIKRLAVPSESGSAGQIGLPAAAKKIMLKYQPSTKPLDKHVDVFRAKEENISMEDSMNYSDFGDNDDVRNDNDSDEDLPIKENTQITPNTQTTEAAPSSNLQFTVSIRGSLQVILNRYIYNLHSTAATGVRRWRCVEYRNHRCKAFVVTKDNVVINRANLHNHSFHDKKILQKIEKKAVFSALDDLQGYKEKEIAAEKEAEESAVEVDQEDYVTLDMSAVEQVMSGDGIKRWTLKRTHK